MGQGIKHLLQLVSHCLYLPLSLYLEPINNYAWKIKRLLISAEFKWDRYFVNKVKTQLKEKPLWGSQTQEFYYLEDKASNQTVTLIPLCSNCILHSDTLPNMNASQPSILRKGVFNEFLC
jgi:hypothetical protein